MTGWLACTCERQATDRKDTARDPILRQMLAADGKHSIGIV